MSNCIIKTIIAILVIYCSTISAQPKRDLLYVFRAALNQAPYIKSEYWKYKSQSIKEDIKLGEMLPSLDLIAIPEAMNVSEGDFKGTTVGAIYRATLSQVLFDYNLYMSYKAFQKDSLASQANYLYLKQQYLTDVLKAYFRVVFTQRRLKITKQKLSIQHKLLNISEEKFQKRLIHVGDLEQIRADYLITKARLADNKRALNSEYYELEKLIAEPINNILVEFDEKLLKPPYPLNIKHWINLGIQNNFNLKFKQHRSAFQRDAIQACYGKFMPRVRLNITYGYNINPFIIPGTDIAYVAQDPIKDKIKSNYQQFCLEETTVSTIPAGSKGLMNIPLIARYVSASIGITLSWNILSGGATAANLNKTAEQYVQSRYDTQQTEREMKLQIEKSYFNTLSYLRETQLLKSTITSSKLAYKNLMEKYKLNLTSVSDALEQLNLTYNAKYQRENIMTRYIYSYLDLKLASGTLSVEDVAKFNHLFRHGIE
jgi:outer membrane protein